MKTSPVQILDKAVKDWIAFDLPPSEKESLSPTLLEALHNRFAAQVETPEPVKPEPVKKPPHPPPAPEPKPAAKKAKAKHTKPKLKAKAKYKPKSRKTRH